MVDLLVNLRNIEQSALEEINPMEMRKLHYLSNQASRVLFQPIGSLVQLTNQSGVVIGPLEPRWLFHIDVSVQNSNKKGIVDI